MSAFNNLPTGLKNVNASCKSFTMQQLFPKTSAISTTRVNTGAANGMTQFQFMCDNSWWIPALSYFDIRFSIQQTNGNGVTRSSGLSYIDTPLSTLFSQIQFVYNGTSIELLQSPAVVESALLYSAVDKNWLDTTGSLQCSGEGLVGRQNRSSTPAPATNPAIVEATWRPSLSIFDCPYPLPPSQGLWEFDFSWSNTAERDFVQSMYVPIPGTTYQLFIQSFVLYIAQVTPEMGAELPSVGVIELNPIQVNSYTITGGTVLNQNIALASTVNRMLLVCQDSNIGNAIYNGNGLLPINDYTISFSNGVTSDASYIQQLYLSWPDLQIQTPSLVYNLGPNLNADYIRAFADYLSITRGGGTDGISGALSYGSINSGITVIAPNAPSGAVYTQGDPMNIEGVNICTSLTTWFGSNINALTGLHTQKWGWIGKKPIFAFGVFRPQNVMLSNAQLYLTFSGPGPTSATIYTLQSYSMALAVERNPDGRTYNYQVVRGV